MAAKKTEQSPTGASAPVVVADYIRVKAPLGYETTVPKDILEILLASGYVVVK